jgi:hypothetical protein
MKEFKSSLLKGKSEDADSRTEDAVAKDLAKARSKVLYEAKIELLEDLKTGYARLPAEVVKAVKSREKADGLERLKAVVEDMFRVKLEERT